MMTIDTAASVGLLVARLVFGLYMAAHGCQKLLGWFGGRGLDDTAALFATLGFNRALTAAATAAEIASGLLIALGFLGPVGPALMVLVMLVAVGVNWKNGAFASVNGVELPLLYAAVGTTLSLTGPGSLSADALLGLEWLSTPIHAQVALAVALVAALANLFARRP